MGNLQTAGFILFFLLAPLFTFAQAKEVTDSTLYSIETVDGNQFIGYKLSEDNEVIVMYSENYGEFSIAKNQIKSITVIQSKQIVEGRYYFDNPQATRYFWSPNGYGLHKGEGYYQNVWIFFNQFSVGVSENFSIGAGLVPTFLFGTSSTPVWITPKFSVPISEDKINIGAGGLFATVLGEEGTGFGIVYGNVTIGNKDKNANIGLGWGFAEDFGWADSPTVTFSTMIRIGPKGYFLSENYVISGGGDNLVLISAGGRSIIQKVSLDYGLFIPIAAWIDNPIAIPWLGLVVPFGQRDYYKR